MFGSFAWKINLCFVKIVADSFSADRVIVVALFQKYYQNKGRRF